MASARKPIVRDSPRATTPRTIGMRIQRCFFSADSTGRFTSAISPFCFRTATDHAEGPRIMTPSRTACPPIGALTATPLGAAGAPAGLLQPALEPLHASAGVHELLLARVERVALGADLDVEIALGRARLEGVPARAGHRGENVLGMSVGLHVFRFR